VTSPGPDVVVIGDALLDVTARPSAPIRSGADVPAEVRIAPGGQGANLAVRLARQGASVELVCALGDDPAAKLVAHALRAEGVHLRQVAAPATGAVVILLDASGERTMLSRRSAFASLIELERLPTASWVLISGYLLLEADASRFAAAVARGPARRAIVGCTVPGPALSTWRSAAEAARPDLLILNRDEGKALTSVEAIATGAVVTGADLVEATIGDLRIGVPVQRSAQAVDTTGAGDAFAAAVVAGLLGAAWPPPADRVEATLASAAALAAEVTLVDGAQARVPAEAAAGLGG
jgi:sugar/nucleoside kinase (ribokinase family)